MINVLPTEIPDVVFIEPRVFGDARGYFFESWSQRDFDAAVGPVRFVQDNESKSRYGVLSDEAVFQYKCDNYYAPEAEGAIAWDDPALGIDWKIPAQDILLSDKDRRHPRLADVSELFD